MRKLVRDKLHLNPQEGQKFGLVIGPEDYTYLLKEKLQEEYQELQKAIRSVNLQSIHGELVDLMEVLFTICNNLCYQSRQELIDAVHKKYEMKGGFEAGIVLTTED